MPKYFTLKELIKSDTAKRLGIDNTPSFEVVKHLERLVEEFLDPLREAWGKAVRISSGYRCPSLNRAVGGSSTSAHMDGNAADMQTSGPFTEFRDFTLEWVKATSRKFDQLIVEKDSKTGTLWLHVGLYNSKGAQRGQIKFMVK